jgi:hypothetical protein
MHMAYFDEPSQPYHWERGIFNTFFSCKSLQHCHICFATSPWFLSCAPSHALRDLYTDVAP